MTKFSTLRTAALSFAVALTALGTVFGLAARAEDACAISLAAGKPAPARPDDGKADQFRIFWQVSTQIEDLADAAGNQAALRDIREARSHSDGYYINTLLAGPLTYWPGRPKQCATNQKIASGTEAIEIDGEIFQPTGGTAVREACADLQKDFVRKTGKYDSTAEMQSDALRRTIGNLDLAGEQERGKPIWGAQIILSTDFSYERQADKVSMKRLPRTYCFLNNEGMTLNGMLMYMEPRIQVRQGNFLWIPLLDRKGRLKDTDKSRLAKIPENVHAFDLLSQAFAGCRGARRRLSRQYPALGRHASPPGW